MRRNKSTNIIVKFLQEEFLGLEEGRSLPSYKEQKLKRDNLQTDLSKKYKRTMHRNNKWYIDWYDSNSLESQTLFGNDKVDAKNQHLIFFGGKDF